MKRRCLVARSVVPVPVEFAWSWFLRPASIVRLDPPWDWVEIRETPQAIADGARAVFFVPFLSLRFRFVHVYRDLLEPRSFSVEQRDGPFARWLHTVRFDPQGPVATRLEDRVEFAMRGGGIGDRLGGPIAGRRLRRWLGWRHARARLDLERHWRLSGSRPLRVAVSGAGGLLGSALASFLEAGGHEVLRLVRRPAAGPREIAWDPIEGPRNPRALEGLDALVHLAGENIAAGRWTRARRERIYGSRVQGTRSLASSLRSLARPPRVFLTASAVGFYGDRPEEPLAEDSGRGRGFLAETCAAWEEAALEAEQAGARVVRARLGVVLAAGGGALRKMLPAFRAGLGGPIGSGRQHVSWIGLEDAVGALHFLLLREDLEGAFNVTAPQPVPNAEFAAAVGRVLGRPARWRLPERAVLFLFGEMGKETLLSSQAAVPRRLEQAGFVFSFPDLEQALRFELGRLEPGPVAFEGS
jgi:hypothetical protein